MTDPAHAPEALDEAVVRVLYRRFLDRWNERDAQGMADLFAEDGSIVGFDGSSVNARADIAAHLSDVFASHETATFVGLVRDVRRLVLQLDIL